MRKYILTLLLVLMMMFSTLAYLADYEELELNQEFTFHLDDVNGEDWYRVTLPTAGALSVHITAKDSLQLRGRLYDVDESSILVSNESGTSSSMELTRLDLNPGTYIFRIQRQSGEGTYSVVTNFQSASMANDQLPGNLQSTAYLLDLEEGATGLLGYHTGGKTDSEVWYQVTILQPGSLTLDIQGEEDLLFDTRLYDTNHSTLVSDESDRVSVRKLHYPNLNPGQYTFRVRRNSGHGRYAISPIFITQRAYPGHPPAYSADNAPLLLLNRSYSGLLGFQGAGSSLTQSWYNMDLSTENPLLIQVTTDDLLKTGLRLYSNSSTVVSDEGGRTSGRILTLDSLQPGIYSLRIIRQAEYGDYHILATGRLSGSAVNPAQYDFGEVILDSKSGMKFSLINLEIDPIQVESVGIIGPDADSFTIADDDLIGKELAGRDYSQLLVLFNPKMVGTKEATLIFETAKDQYQVDLSGAGYQKTPPDPSLRNFVVTPERPQVKGESTLVSPGSGRQSKNLFYIDARAFRPGSVLTIQVEMGAGESSGSFDLFPEHHEFSESGRPVGSLAYVYDIRPEGRATLVHTIEEPQVFKFNASGNWGSPQGAVNSFYFNILVESKYLTEEHQELAFTGERSIQLEEGFAITPNTFEAWVRVPSDFPSNRRIGVILGNYPANPNVNWEIHQSGRPRLWWNGQLDWSVNHVDMRTGQWEHMAFVRDPESDEFFFYLNGELEDTFVRSSREIIPLEPFYIGGDRRGINAPMFQGDIKEIRVWSTTRTQEEILDMMEQDLTGLEPGLLGLWSLVGGTLDDERPHIEKDLHWEEILSMFQELLVKVEAAEKEAMVILQFLVEVKETLSFLEIGLANQDRDSVSHLLQVLAQAEPESITYPNLLSYLKTIKERAGQMLSTLPEGEGPEIWTDQEHQSHQDIVIHFANLPGNQQDWITIVSRDAPDTDYGQYFYSGGKQEGSFFFRGVVSGEYEARLYLDWPDGGYQVEMRFPFIVVD